MYKTTAYVTVTEATDEMNKAEESNWRVASMFSVTHQGYSPLFYVVFHKEEK